MNISIRFFTAGQQPTRGAAEVCLGYREIYQQQGDLRGVEIRSMEGQIWVTQPGDPDDHILGPGESFKITRSGRLVVQGMGLARFRLCEPKKETFRAFRVILQVTI